MDKAIDASINIFVFISFLIVMSYMEACLYNRLVPNHKPKTERTPTLLDEHFSYVIIRIMFAAALFNSVNIILHIGLVFLTPFFHDGFYYMFRNSMDPEIYKKGFKDSSKTTTAVFSFDYQTRIVLGCMSILYIFIYYKFFA
jgi:hypothetical protein